MNIRYWIKAARLRTLPLAFSCILISAALAVIAQNTISFKLLFLTLTTTLLLQILSNFANDYGDAIKGADKNRIGEPRMVESGKISKNQMKFAIIIFGFLSFIFGSVLTFSAFPDNFFNILIFLCLGIGAITAAIKYTVGKSAYGYKAYGDFSVFIFFGLIGVIGSYYIFTHSFNWITLPASLFTGFLSCSVLNLNNMRDYHNDKSNNKVTLVVKIGVKRAKNYHFFLILLAVSSFSILLAYTSLIYILGAIPLFVLIKHLVMVKNESNLRNLDGQLKIVALTCFTSTLTYFIISLSNTFFS